jgi:hypothetical protein
MALLPPNLDDRSFEDIFALAKALIPRYAPQWTNFNESDPGIALLQLYAWMTEMTLFRLNQVPERNYLKFLQLLGIQQKPASCARAQLTFSLDTQEMARRGVNTVNIPKGTRVAATAPGVDDTGAALPPPIFETDRSLTAIAATLAQLLSFDGVGFTPLTALNDKSQPFYPFGRNVRQGSAFLLGFDSNQAFPASDITLLVNVFIDSTGGSAQSQSNACDPGLLFSQPPVTLNWEFYDGQRWRPLSLIEDETLAFTRSGFVSLAGPGARIRQETFPGGPDTPLYWLRARLTAGSYQRPPQIEKIMTNAVSATQLLTVREETLGGSDGRPHQTFTLDNTPVVAHEIRDADGATIVVSSLELVIDEGNNTGVPNQSVAAADSAADTRILWQEVADFNGSTRDSRHYTLDRFTGQIVFGDGERGRIPPFNARNRNGNIVARRYEYGGGISGNLPADQITQLQTNVDLVNAVTNPRQSIGGANTEPLADAKLRARQVVQNRDRAVTVDDFIKMAVETPGANIRRAHAIPLTHPRFPGVEVPGVVTVVIVPNSDEARPIPTEDTIRLVCAYLSRRRLLTTEVYVTSPHYRKITIEAQLVAEPGADLGEVESAVQQRLATYFHPFLGGDDGAGWPFGADVVYSDIYRQILTNPQVDRIEGKLVIYLDDVKQAEYADVSLADNDLLYTEGHRLDVRYRERK